MRQVVHSNGAGVPVLRKLPTRSTSPVNCKGERQGQSEGEGQAEAVMYLLTIYPARECDNRRLLLFRSWDALEEYREKQHIKASSAQAVPVKEL